MVVRARFRVLSPEAPGRSKLPAPGEAEGLVRWHPLCSRVGAAGGGGRSVRCPPVSAGPGLASARRSRPTAGCGPRGRSRAPPESLRDAA